MEPAVLLSAIFLFAVILGFAMYDYWQLPLYGSKTTLIFLTGIFAFVFGGILTIPFRNKHSSVKDTDTKGVNRLLPNEIAVLLSILIAIAAVVYMINFFRGHASGVELGEMISDFKGYKRSDEADIPTMLSILLKTTAVFSYLNLICLINNCVADKFRRQDALLVITPLLYCITCIVQASRVEMLSLAIAGFAAWYILQSRKNGWRVYDRKKVLKYGAISVAIALGCFWGFVFIMQGSNSIAQQHGFMEYICNYVSGSLSSFDLYLKQGDRLIPEWFGQETFVTLNNNLNSLFGIGHEGTRHLEYRSGFGYSVVNIYSSFRRFYHDFDFAGVIVLSMFQGFVTTYIYGYIKTKRYSRSVDFTLLVYCFFLNTLIYITMEDTFYTSYFSIYGIMKVLLLAVSYWFFFLKLPRSKLALMEQQS